MQKIKIPTIIAIVILTIGLALGTILIQSQKIFRLGADETAAPQNVKITNISASSFSVSWTTRKETGGLILWSDSPSSIKNSESDEISTQGYLHHVSVNGLGVEKTYYFKINSDGVEYDNNGAPWTVKIPNLTTPLNVKPITGTVLTSTGTPAAKVLVYLNIGGASPLSTVTSDNGSFVFSLNNLLTTNLDSVFSLNETSDISEVSVQAGPLGISSAQIYASSARPTPPLLLGQVHDFKNLPPNSDSDASPQADINTPELFEKTSKFDTSASQSTTLQPGTISITSVDEGESISTQKPQFSGKGPSGEEITITVESENPITGNATVTSGGNWNWSPPTSLAPGTHSITISYRDDNGILRKVIRNFTIQAAEGPAFVATPSATPKVSPTSSPRASASATPIATKTATPVPQPVSGIPLPTLMMLIFGIGIFATGVFVSAKSTDH